MPATHTAFTGDVPKNYERYLRPALFEPYAVDLAARLPRRPGLRLLELACGTGVVTRRLLEKLPGDGRLIATDLNAAMIDIASGAIADPRLSWQPADAQALPFPDASFDAVVCQFGVMFFPDKAGAIREAKRVLAPGGRLLYNSWDGLAGNPATGAIHTWLARRFPQDPPQFLTVPHGYGDPEQIRADFAAGGFPDATITALSFEMTTPAADDYAAGFVFGTPLSGLLRDRSADHDAIRRELAVLLAQQFGAAPLRAPMKAWVIEAVG